MRVFPDLTVDGEFKALGDTGVSGSLNDRQFTYLGNSGYTGALPDRFGEYKGFTPASLFSGASSRGFMFDFRDYNTLFTGTAGTTRVTSTNQAVARVNDKSGLGNNATQATLGNRPLSVIFPSSGVRNRANGSADVGNNTYWASSNTTNGITVTRVGSGFDTDGLPYADYTVVGTASADSTINTYDRTQSRNPALTGQTYAIGSMLQRTAGTAPPAGCGINFAIIEETAPTTVLVVNSAAVTTLTASDQTVTYSATLGNASTNQVCGTARIFTSSGSTVNYTVRIKALQFELGSSRTSYQFNYSAQNVTESGFASIRGIQFDGVDDWLQTAAIDFSNSDEVTVVAGLRKLSDAGGTGIIAELGPASFSTDGSFVVFASNGGPNYGFITRGTLATASQTLGTFTAPISNVVSVRYDNSGSGTGASAQNRPRVNGIDLAAVSGTTAGNYRNDIVYIGRRNGSVFPFNGVLTFLFAINRLLTANELAAVEAYANGRTGAF